MNKKVLLFLGKAALALALIINSNSILAQSVGGREGAVLAPGTTVEAAQLSGGGISGDVNVLTGAYSSSYNLGSVTTPGGLSFSLNMTYGAAYSSGDTPPISSGIPYGEGWNVDLPKVSVSTDAYLKYTQTDICNILGNTVNPDTTLEFDMQEAANEGSLYWFAPYIHVPGVVSGRAVFKRIEQQVPVFVCNSFERYAELQFFGDHLTVTTDDGTVFTFKVQESKWRAATNQRAFDYYTQEDMINNGLGVPEQNALRNLIIPKEEQTTWYCTQVHNPNIPSRQSIRFEYEKYGAFNYFQEYLQPAVYEALSNQLGTTSFPFIPNMTSYSDVLLTKVISFSNYSIIDVIELDYATIEKNIANQTFNMIDYRDSTAANPIGRKDSLWNYKTVYQQNNAFNSWNRYAHQKSDLAYANGSNNATGILATNPYLRPGTSGSSLEYTRLGVPSNSSKIPFDHCFLESPRIGNTAGSFNSETLIPGDVYEVKTTIKNEHITPGGINTRTGTVDINLATNLINNPNYDNTTGSSYDITNYNNSRGESVFSTFNQAIKWHTGGSQSNSQYTQTSNYFVMPNLPENYQGFHIQVGAGNSDNDFSMDATDPINGMIIPTGGNNLATAYKSYVHNKNVSVSNPPHGSQTTGLLAGANIPANFGIGLPWAMANPVLNLLAGGHLPNHPQSYQYRFWWNTLPATGTNTWANEPTTLDDSVYLEKVELVRYSKNPYMLKNVKTYKVNGKTSWIENDDKVLVSQVHLQYDVDTLRYAENQHYQPNENLVYSPLKAQNIFTLSKIHQIPTIPTQPGETDLDTVDLNEQLTIHLNYDKLGHYDQQHEQWIYDVDQNGNPIDSVNLGSSFVARPAVVLTEVVDQIGGITHIEYNDPEHYSTVVSTRFRTPVSCSNSGSLNRGSQQVFDIRPTVKWLERMDDAQHNPLAKRTNFEYSYERITCPDQLATNQHFRGQSITNRQVGFKSTKKILPEVAAGVRPYSVYHHIGFNPGLPPVGSPPEVVSNWLNQTPSISEYLLYGKLHKLEQYDANHQLVEETEITWEHSLAYENGLARPDFVKEAGEFDYEDYYFGYSAYDPTSFTYANHVQVWNPFNEVYDPVPGANVTIKLELYQKTNGTETSLYRESNTSITNANGDYEVVLGNGTPTHGSLNAINWGANIYLRVSDSVYKAGTLEDPAFTLEYNSPFTGYPQVPEFQGNQSPFGTPRFYDFYFYQDLVNENAPYFAHSYFIKKLSETNRSFDAGCVKGTLPGNNEDPPLVEGESPNPFGFGFDNPVVVHPEEPFVFSLMNTLPNKKLLDTLIHFSPLSDTLLQTYISQKALTNTGAVRKVLQAQPNLSNDVLIDLLNQVKHEKPGIFLRIARQQSYLSDTVLEEVLNNSHILPPYVVQRSFFQNPYNYNGLLEKMLSVPVHEAVVRNVWMRQEELPTSMVIKLINRRPYFSNGTIIRVLKKQPNLTDEVYLAVLNRDLPFKNGVIRKIYISSPSYPSDVALTALANRPKRYPPRPMLQILEDNPYPISPEVQQALKDRKYPKGMLTLVEAIHAELSPLLVSCNNTTQEQVLAMENITEYEYYEAGPDGQTNTAAYKNLMGLENEQSIRLKYEPSWQVYRVKTYSPQYPGAYNEKEAFYYYDLKNRYLRHMDYYKEEDGFVAVDGLTGAHAYYYEEGLTAATKDTAILFSPPAGVHSNPYPVANGYNEVLFPNPDGLVKAQEYGLRNLTYQNRTTTKNNVDTYALERSTYSFYDSRWNNLTDPTYLQSTIPGTTCPPSGGTGNVFVDAGCEQIHFKTFAQLESDVPMFHCAYVDSTNASYPIYVCPSDVIEVTPTVGVLLCNPDNAEEDFLAKIAPITQDLTKTVMLRNTVVQIDTLNTNNFEDSSYFELQRPIMDFVYQGQDDKLRHLWQPIYPFDTLKTQHIYERNEYGQVQLEGDVENLLTRYYFDAREVEDVENLACPDSNYRNYYTYNIGMPNRITVGYTLPDSLSTTMEYYPSYHVYKTVDPNQITYDYTYDKLGRLHETWENDRVLNANRYHYWNNDHSLTFRERAALNFVESITYNNHGPIPREPGNSVEVNAAYVDPLGRAHNAISFPADIAAPEHNYLMPFKHNSTGEVVYDNWDRPVKTYKPFTYTIHNGTDHQLIPRLNTVIYDPQIGAQGPAIYNEASYENNQRSRSLLGAKMGEDIASNYTVKNRYKYLNYLQLACELKLSAYEQDLMMPQQAEDYRYTRVETEDEDGKIAVQYTNAIGQKVATLQPVDATYNAVTLFYYDSYGNLTKVINPEKQETNYHYNLLGQLYQKETVDDSLTYYMYNKRGQIALSQDARGYAGEVSAQGSSVPFFRQYLYDNFGRLTLQQKRKLASPAEVYPSFASLPVVSPLLYKNEQGGTHTSQNSSDYYRYTFTNNSTYSWKATTVASYPDGGTAGGSPTLDTINVLLVNHYLTDIQKEKEWYYHKALPHSGAIGLTHPNTDNLLNNHRHHMAGMLSHTIDYGDDDFTTSSTNLPVKICWYSYNQEGRVRWQLQQFNQDGITPTNKGMTVRIDHVEYTPRGSLMVQRIDVDNNNGLDLEYFYKYDGYNRLSEVHAGYIDRSIDGNLLAKYEYDDALQLLTKTRYYHNCGSGTDVEIDQINYQYDVRDRLTAMQSTLLNYQLYYDNNLATYNNSSLVAQQNHNGNINGIKATYTLQGATNYSAVSGAFDGPTVYGYTYDGINRLTAADATVGDHVSNHAPGTPWYTFGDVELEYDLIGNIEHLKRYKTYDGTSLSNTHTDEWDYNYQAGTNRLLQAEGIGTSTHRNFTYDANGNLLTDNHRAIASTNYGRGNYPFELTTDTKTISYLYNNANQRIFKEVQAISDVYDVTPVKEFYLIAPTGQTLGILNQLSGNWTWYANGTERFAKITPKPYQQPQNQPTNPNIQYPITTTISNTLMDSISYYIHDHLGNTRVVYNGSVASCDAPTPLLTLEYLGDYYPYGKTLREYVGVEEKYLTTHHERDKETGLDYRGARYYDSDLGRFLSLDPLAEKYPNFSDYSYVADNPIMYIDPTGKYIKKSIEGGGDPPDKIHKNSKYIDDGTKWTNYVRSIVKRRQKGKQIIKFRKSEKIAVTDGTELTLDTKTLKNSFIIKQGGKVIYNSKDETPSSSTFTMDEYKVNLDEKAEIEEGETVQLKIIVKPSRKIKDWFESDAYSISGKVKFKPSKSKNPRFL